MAQQPAYATRKAQHFRTGDEQVIAHNPAFIFDDPERLQRFAQELQKTEDLYYQEQLTFWESDPADSRKSGDHVSRSNLRTGAHERTLLRGQPHLGGPVPCRASGRGSRPFRAIPL